MSIGLEALIEKGVCEILSISTYCPLTRVTIVRLAAGQAKVVEVGHSWGVSRRTNVFSCIADLHGTQYLIQY